MQLERIDFISAYCDRWCERCAFTARCSAYAVGVATAMCDGDFKAGLELAVGAPPPENAEEERRRKAFLEGLVNHEQTPQELEEVRRELEERKARVDESPLTPMAMAAFTLSRRWLEEHRDRVLKTGDPVVVDAIEVAAWDSFLIGAKVHRALDGRDTAESGGLPDEDPVQNDWNGSAKVALISMQRSALAWDTLAEATGDPDAAAVAGHLRTLRLHVEAAFPDAWRFIRPGFDGGA